MRQPGTLTAVHLSKSYGSQAVLADVSVSVSPGSRIGLVGPNGAGKSTLLRLLAGLERPDGGRVLASPPLLAVGYLPQEPEALPGETVLAYLARRSGVGEAEARMEELAAALAHDPGRAEAYGTALERFLALGGADLAVRARATLAELGLPGERLGAETTSLSGGEAARVGLAAVLVSRFDVFLLDEPTNDLDFAGLERLERFLASLPGAAVIVSHDRDFLDRSVGRIVELDEWTHGAREYAGGWSEYAGARELERGRQSARFDAFAGETRRLEEQRRRMQDWERRGYGQGRKKKKSKDVAKSFAGRIERLDRVDKPYEPWRLQLELGSGARSGESVVRLEGAVVRQGDFSLGPLDFELGWRDRLAISGPNGSGKTTPLAGLLGRLPLAEGRRIAGPGVVFGELEQRRSALAGDESLLAAFCGAASSRPEEARTLLAKFGLGADHVLRPSSSLSPGERTRAVLAILAARGVNCLVLDEPTNHLDVEAIEELERALDSFGGTVLLVTHDRRFLEGYRATRALELDSRGRVTLS